MSTIPNNLRADIFRQRIESKNTLTTKGSLYVGTGQFFGSGSATVYTTDQLPPGPNNAVFGVFADTTYGVGYDSSVRSRYFADNAITKEKIAVVANDSIGDSHISGKISSTKITGVSFVASASGDLTITFN